LMIFFIKSQGVYDAASLSGVYFFTAAVVLMILAYSWLRTDTVRETTQPATATLGLPDVAQDEGRAERPYSPLRNVVLSLLIILATVFFALGVTLPVIKFTTVYVWTNEHSIATIIYALYQNQEYFLCAVVFAFSVLFPFLKLFYLLTLVTSPDLPYEFRQRSFRAMEWLGRYSMTDVMVLALLIFYVNSSGYTEADVQPGVYFFLMTMFAYGWANSVAGVKRGKKIGG
jgi:paraquat-inducible protein A